MKRFKTLVFIALICTAMFSSISTFAYVDSKQFSPSDLNYNRTDPSSVASSSSTPKTDSLNDQQPGIKSRGNLRTGIDTQKNWNFDKPQDWRDFAWMNENSAEIIIGVNTERHNSLTELQNILSKHQGRTVNTVSIRGEIVAVVVDVPLNALSIFAEEVRSEASARYIEPNMKVQAQLVPNDPYWSLQWGPQKIEADWAWNTTVGDTSVLVAVVDSGIDYTHPDLAANYVPLGYDWVNMDADPIDDFGHGTHVAGIIAAVLDNSIGIAGLAQVQIMAEKVLTGEGYGYWDWVANGIVNATDCGADIISMSLGGYGDSVLVHDAVKYAYDSGVLVVAAAGNDNISTKLYPAGYDEVVAVAATDQLDNKASFSNWGDWIELAAPGVGIYSTVPWGYESSSGTSMATPHVSGVAALAWSQFPNKSRDWIRLWLRYTADDLGAPGFDVYYGFGRVNARKAVEQTPPAHELIAYSWITPPYVEPGTSETINATILNFGENNEANVTVQLFANGTLIDSKLIGLLAGGNQTTVSLLWLPAVEGKYNVTLYVVPVPGETSVENNVLWKQIYVGTPVKAVVLHSAGNIAGDIITNWQVLNSEWNQFGQTMIYIDYTSLNKDNITYEEIAATKADVLIISCAYDPWMGWQFTDSEIEAIKQYVFEGHGLIATAGTFYYEVPNNNKLAPLFGMNETTRWGTAGTDLFEILEPSHPIFAKIPNPLIIPLGTTAVPWDGRWDSNELVGGKYLALGHFLESAIVVYRGLVYISPWLEIFPSYYHHNLQLVYNAITWSRYQKPEHELTVSLEAPSHLKPGQSTLLNASVLNLGLNNETNVTLSLLINGVNVSSDTIPLLSIGSSYRISYPWTPPSEDRYNITAYASPVPGEDNLINNKKTKFVSVTSLAIGIIETHGESLHTDYLKDYYTNLGYCVEEITATLTFELLRAFQFVVVGEDWSNMPWASSEIKAVREYLVSGGGFVAIGDELAQSVQQILEWYGIRYSYAWPYWGPTSNFDRQHPIMQDVNVLYAGDPINAFYVNPPLSYYIARDASNMYILIAGSEVEGYVLSMADDFAAYLYDYDNQIMFRNIVTWIAVTYEHELVVTLEAPAFLMPEESSLLNATVRNKGLKNETDVELYLSIDENMVNQTTIPELKTADSYTISYLWTPSKTGTYNVTAYAPPVAGENFTRNNRATVFVSVSYPLINPKEGQWANYILQYFDEKGTLIGVGKWNMTYYHYITPYLINVTTWMQDPSGYITIGWMTVNIMNRLVEQDSGIYWAGMWYPGWIETNITLGSTINLLFGRAIVVNSTTIEVNRQFIDCWELLLPYYGNLTYTFWYDKASGLWIAMEFILEIRPIEAALPFEFWLTIPTSGLELQPVPVYRIRLMLVATNIPIGFPYEHELTVSLEAPEILALGDSALLNATVFNRGLSVETDVELQFLINESLAYSEIIPELANGSSSTISYLWTPIEKASFNVTAYVLPVVGENVTTNNRHSRFVLVRLPLIKPKPGDYANYGFITKAWSTEYSGTINYTYLEYVNTYTIKIRATQFYLNTTLSYNLTVNTLTRLIETGPEWMKGTYYYEWIETDIDVGSTFNLLSGTGTVVGVAELTINSKTFNTWVVLAFIEALNAHIVSYYDKSTGLLIKAVWKDPRNTLETTITLLETNVDVTPPSIRITIPPYVLHIIYTASPNITVGWTAYDDETGIDHYELYLNGTLLVSDPRITLYNFSNLPDGMHNVTVVAYDKRGNWASDYLNVIVDLTPPNVKITSPTDGYITKETSISVSWELSDTQTGVSFSDIYLDGRWIAISPVMPYTLTDLTEGTHNITIKAQDLAGNTQSHSITVEVDLTAPTVSIVNPVDKSFLKESIPINVSGYDRNFRMMLLYIDGNQVLNTTSQTYTYVWDTATAVDGAYTIRVVSVDKAGNVAEKQIAVTTINQQQNIMRSNLALGISMGALLGLVVGGIIAFILTRRKLPAK